MTRLERFGDVWLKREDVHELGAFKWRGALPTLARYRQDVVVTASTGNHGAATAWAAKCLGMRAIVYVPRQVSPVKRALIERFGADLRDVGVDLDEAKDHARAFAARGGIPFFEDGAEPAQYEAYGSIADELIEQCRPRPAAILVPVGNGALLGGVGRRLGKGTLRVGVVAKEAPVMADSWEAGGPVASERCATFADGLAVRVAIPLAVTVLQEAADRIVRVSERAIAQALGAFARSGIRVEAAAAAALAGLPQVRNVGGPIVVVVTGRNIGHELWLRAVERPDLFPD